MMTLFRVVIVLVVLACLAPLFAVITAATISDLYNCPLDEGTIRPCIIAGQDYGHDLYTLSMMGWFLMATFPVFLAAVALWLVVEVLRWLRQSKAAS